MKYNPNEIEAFWQKYWATNKVFSVKNNTKKPKYYVLDMFPYPSGAGLHVGHPLGYIASDVYSRFKRHQGFNVLHPMGYDSFGLPAEQYAIQTGQRPEDTTSVNIDGGVDKEGNIIPGYRKQLDKIGFSFNWEREVRTSNPDYYKHTQWIFIQLFNSWYNKNTNKAENITTLIAFFEKEGNTNVNAVCDDDIPTFSATEWMNFLDDEKQKILLYYRLTYLAETEVNWCEGLGTVLANDEIVNGVSERGGFPVVRKKMKQWSMRISAYAERLLQGLNDIDWSESIKESQRNWIGKSKGASIKFKIQNHENLEIEVFTTRPDTIFGVSFMTLAPEHPLVQIITTNEHKDKTNQYIEQTSKRSERERMADVKTISGVFTGAYAIHPFTGKNIPVWIGDYVLAGYGTGAVMAVPAGDERDFAFANYFGISIKNIFDKDISTEAFTQKGGFTLVNSDFLNGLDYKQATDKIITALEEKQIGKGKTNYRLRDAVFSRQRYWGEPFPVYYVNHLPQMIDAQHLPIILPEVENYLPTKDGQPPLGNAKKWAWNTQTNQVVDTNLIDNKTIFPLELNTMPGWAGSSWYWMRYMDAHNENEFAGEEALKYWQNVDLYIGGSEHATGHLLYSRFWNKFLFDLGYAPTEEPFKKLINQGMILGMSAYVDVITLSFWDNEGAHQSSNKFQTIISKELSDFYGNNYDLIERIKNQGKTDLLNAFKNEDLGNFEYITNEFQKLAEKFDCIEPGYGLPFPIRRVPIDINLINESNNTISKDNYEKALNFTKTLNLITNKNSEFKVSREIEKMSKSKYNVVTPDAICNEYGADTLRLYEMFLGPLEQAKPWNTAGISGVFGFLKKLWRLYFDENGLIVTNNEPSKESLKTLHKTIKKVNEDVENFSLNTSVSQFMICVNELSTQNCHERAILEPLAVLISPYAPHIAEELWLHLKGLKNSKIENLKDYKGISEETFPVFEEKYLVESEKEYPVSFNGKMRFTIKLPLDLSKEQIQEIVLKDERTQKQLNGKMPNKIIIVPGKIINFVG